MKTLPLFLTAALLCLSFGAKAQNNDFPKLADHGVYLQDVMKEWHDQGLYTAGWDDKPTIKNYFVGLANAYPDDLFQMIVSKLLGLGVDDALTEFTLDEKNGFISGELGTETTPSVQMCYWNCKDGSRLIAVALQGYEYNMDDTLPEIEVDEEEYEEDDNVFVCLNDIAFFRIRPDEMIWRPVAVKDICGRDFSFILYDRIELPRQGKDIRLVEITESGDEDVTTLSWDGTRFTVK